MPAVPHSYHACTRLPVYPTIPVPVPCLPYYACTSSLSTLLCLYQAPCVPCHACTRLPVYPTIPVPVPCLLYHACTRLPVYPTMPVPGSLCTLPCLYQAPCIPYHSCTSSLSTLLCLYQFPVYPTMPVPVPRLLYTFPLNWLIYLYIQTLSEDTERRD